MDFEIASFEKLGRRLLQELSRLSHIWSNQDRISERNLESKVEMTVLRTLTPRRYSEKVI